MAHFSNFQDWGGGSCSMVEIRSLEPMIGGWLVRRGEVWWSSDWNGHANALDSHKKISYICMIYAVKWLSFFWLLSLSLSHLDVAQETELQCSHVYSASASACACGGQWQGTLLIWSQATERRYQADVIMYSAVTWRHCYSYKLYLNIYT